VTALIQPGLQNDANNAGKKKVKWGQHIQNKCNNHLHWLKCTKHS